MQVKKNVVFILCFLFIGVLLFGYDTEKKPFKAGTLSFFVPGAGQIYNNDYLKATAVVALDTYFFLRFLHFDKEYQKDKKKLSEYNSDDMEFSFYYDQYKKSRDSRHDMIWWLGTTVFLSAVDAYVGAHLFNFEKEKRRVHLEFEDNKLSLSYIF